MSNMQPDSSSKGLHRLSGAVEKHINIWLPLATFIAVALYIANICSYEIVIRANINGVPVGYVQSRDVFADAESELEEQLSIAAAGSYELDCRITYDFTHAKNPAYLTEDDCSALLWSYAEEDFCMAYMLYVDDRQAAAYESGEELDALLEDIESELLASGGDAFSRVEISNRLRIENQLCLKSKLMPLDAINELLNPLAHDDDAVSAAAVDEPVSMRISAFTSASPNVSDNPDVDYGLKRTTGEENNDDLTLEYTFVNMITTEEIISYTTQYIDDYDHFIGTNTVTSEGSDGLKSVTYEVSYDVNGNIVDRVAVAESIITPAVDRIVMVGATEIPDPVPTGTFIWPCATPKGISSGYGWRTIYGKTEFHLGIDLPDDKGSPIYASDGGEIIWAGYTPSYGYSIRIQHADDYITVYAHLSKMLVSVGDHVYQGQQIGEMGSTGVSYGSHLHFEVRIGSKTYNPVKYLPELVTEE